MWRRLIAAWRRRAETRALARRPIPDDLWKRTLARYPFLRRRHPDDARQLRRMTSLFLDRKEFSPAGGLVLRNDMVVAIAAQACLPVLRLGLGAYDGFVGIVVHPSAVVATRRVTDELGVVHEYDEPLAGEAMQRGPVMLSWQDVRSAGRDGFGGSNVVIHEFAHVLDMANGPADGVPPLPPDLPARQWQAVLGDEYRRFVARVDAGDTTTVLDPYGAQAEAEFFAVASEAFFVSPLPLRDEHPALYEVLKRLYRQDPVVETAPPA
jgi:Mlc titration factor MtfA (ptsG expression regulator)